MAAVAAGAADVAAQALAPPARFSQTDTVRKPTVAPGIAALESAVVPGAGQYRLGLSRWVPYLAAEAFGWVQYRSHRARSRDLELEFRELAWRVARRVSVGGVRDTADWEYWEHLGAVHASGRFDDDPVAPGTQPETDPTTYNGQQWENARRFIPSGVPALPGAPGYAEALREYERTAIPTAFAWDWAGNLLERRLYNERIRQRDEESRTAQRALGFILANHVASAVDAFVSARLRRLAGADAELREGLEPMGDSFRWSAEVRIPWPAR
jgi:hypothetical protein